MTTSTTATRKAKRLKPKCHRPRRESTKTITTRLYSKWAQVVKALADDKCEITGETGILDAHHIIPRQICSGLRFDPRNGIALSKSAHKFGNRSAHKNGLWFAEWLRVNRPEQYQYCLNHMDAELDCKDRLRLYAIERNLHDGYTAILGTLPRFIITIARSDLSTSDIEVNAYNKKAAELIACSEPVAGFSIKGVVASRRI